MRTLLPALLILCLSGAAPAGAASVLRLSGPPIVESLPLLAMAGADTRWPQDFEARFVPWRSPDMLRAMVAGEQVDAAIVTTAAANTLRNRGVNCRVALLHESPVWIVSTRPGPDTLDSLHGVLLFPFGPSEMPGLFYRAALNGRPSAVTVRHTGGALEAVNLLLAGKGDHAMLSEPTASIALLRAEGLRDRGAPLLVKRVDMRRAWKRAFPGRDPAMSCVAFFGGGADDAGLMRGFGAAYERACGWVRDNPAEALALARKEFPALAAQIERSGTDRFRFHILHGAQAREDALFFLERIGDISPAAIGGTVPGMDLFEAAP